MTDRRSALSPSDSQAATIRLLEAELAETNREVLLLTLEMDKRVEARTAELALAREQLEASNLALRKLTVELDQRVSERTEELRQSEARYRTAAEMLQNEGRRKDEFIALLGHELRNPLAPILNAVHLLRRVATRDQTSERMHAIIDRQVRHLVRLVDDLLDASRITQGMMILQKETVDLVRLVRLTVEDRRPGFDAADLVLEFRLPSDPIWVRGDPTRLSQIVGNLLHNAQKFTDAGGRITVEVGATDEAVVITVRDTGVGIEADVLPTIFDLFSQSARHRGRSGGLGLGLALVKGLVALHGGSVEAASEGIGRGAQFTLTLPLVTGKALEIRGADGKSPSTAGRTILIIEDSRDVAVTMALLLESAGHSVVIAHDGATGLVKAQEARPEIILCDIGLPGDIDGYDIASSVRRDPVLQRVYLVAITGFGREEDKRRAREVGFDAHLTKPVDPLRLERLIANLP